MSNNHSVESISESLKVCRRCALSQVPVNVELGPLPGRWHGDPAPHAPMIIGMNPNVRRTADINFTMGSRAAVSWTQQVLKVVGVGSCWLTNLVKCSTLDNQLTNTVSIACWSWLIAEIVALDPSIIIVSGVQVCNFLGVPVHGGRRQTWGESRVVMVGMNHFAHTVRFGRMQQEMLTLERILRDEGYTSSVD